MPATPALTYPVVYQIKVDDSQLRSSVLNSRLYIDQNLGRPLASLGGGAGAMGTAMSGVNSIANRYTESIKERLWTGANQLYAGNMEAMSDRNLASAGGASLLNRSNLMGANIGLGLSRMTSAGGIGSIFLGDTFSPNMGRSAGMARNQIAQGLASMPVGFGQNAGDLIRQANSMSFASEHDAAFMSRAFQKMNQLGTLRMASNQSQAMQMYKEMGMAAPSMRAMGIDPGQAAAMMNNLVSIAGPTQAGRLLMPMIANKYSGADTAATGALISDVQQRNMMAQRFGVTGSRMDLASVADLSSRSAYATRAFGGMVDPRTGKNFIVDEAMSSRISSSAAQYIQYTGASQEQALRMAFRQETGGATNSAQMDSVIRSTNIGFAGAKQRVARDRDFQQDIDDLNEVATPGGLLRRFARKAYGLGESRGASNFYNATSSAVGGYVSGNISDFAGGGAAQGIRDSVNSGFDLSSLFNGDFASSRDSLTKFAKQGVYQGIDSLGDRVKNSTGFFGFGKAIFGGLSDIGHNTLNMHFGASKSAKELDEGIAAGEGLADAKLRSLIGGKRYEELGLNSKTSAELAVIVSKSKADKKAGMEAYAQSSPEMQAIMRGLNHDDITSLSSVGGVLTQAYGQKMLQSSGFQHRIGLGMMVSDASTPSIIMKIRNKNKKGENDINEQGALADLLDAVNGTGGASKKESEEASKWLSGEIQAGVAAGDFSIGDSGDKNTILAKAADYLSMAADTLRKSIGSAETTTMTAGPSK